MLSLLFTRLTFVSAIVMSPCHAAGRMSHGLHGWTKRNNVIVCSHPNDDPQQHSQPKMRLATCTCRRITTMSIIMASCFLLSRIPLATGLTTRYSFFRPTRTAVSTRHFASVTGTVYTSNNNNNNDNDNDGITIKLFTKEGCTLCDKVKDVLFQVREEHPHTLLQVDITDENHQEWYSKYKYDIPVLHLNDKFWIKHRITLEEATKGLTEAKMGIFQEQKGEPDAGALEQRQAERQQKQQQQQGTINPQ